MDDDGLQRAPGPASGSPSSSPGTEPATPPDHWIRPLPPEALPPPAWRARSAFGRTLDTLAADIGLYLALSLPAALLTGLATLVFTDGQLVPGLVLGLVAAFAAFATSLLMIVVADAMWSGTGASLGRLARQAAPASLRLIGLYLGLALIVALAVVAIVGLVIAAPPVGAIVLLVVLVLGLYAAMRLSALGQVVLIERVDGVAALRRSWQLTRGHVWRLFRLGILVFLVMLPVSMGAQALASSTTVPAVAAVAPVLSTLLTTPLFAISTTIAWADMTGRPHPDNEVVARGTGRGRAFAVLVVPGFVLAVAGWAEGMRTGLGGAGGTAFGPTPGVIVAGSPNPVDPCRPANPRTTFAAGEPIHIGGYFARRLLPGETVRVEIHVDGERVVEEPLELDPLGAECYFEEEPVTVGEPSEWRIVILADEATLAEGSFSVR